MAANVTLGKADAETVGTHWRRCGTLGPVDELQELEDSAPGTITGAGLWQWATYTRPGPSSVWMVKWAFLVAPECEAGMCSSSTITAFHISHMQGEIQKVGRTQVNEVEDDRGTGRVQQRGGQPVGELEIDLTNQEEG